MRKLIIFCIFIFDILFSKIFCLDLREESIVYGLSTVNNYNNSSECSKQLQHFADGIENRKLWAFKLLDANGKPDVGFLWGNNFWLGKQKLCNYIQDQLPLPIRDDDLLLSNHNLSNNINIPFNVNFFGAYVESNYPLVITYFTFSKHNITIGLCLPSICEPDEIQNRLQLYLNENELSIQQLYNVELIVKNVKRLQTIYDWMDTKLFKCMAIIIGSILLMTIFGTIIDLIQQQNPKNENIISRIILCFSLNSNIKSLRNTDLNTDSIPCIHGIRFIIMLWMLFGHNTPYSYDYINIKYDIMVYNYKIFSKIFMNAMFGIDIFFLLSGFLLVYLFLKAQIFCVGGAKTKTLKQQIKEFYILLLFRYLRFTPALLITIIMFTSIAEYYKIAQLIEPVELIYENCVQNWWKNLLYISNFDRFENICLTWTWYLSIDLQFFVIGNILLLFSLRYFSETLKLICGLIIGSCLISAYLAYMNDFVPGYKNVLFSLYLLYLRPSLRIGPYLVGILTGYYAFKINGTLRINQFILGAYWILFVVFNIFVLTDVYTYTTPTLYWSLCTGFIRTIWSCVWAMFLIICITNNAVIVNKFLSHKMFIPFSRLTFSMFLINPFVIIMINRTFLDGVSFHIMSYLIVGITTTIFTIIFGFIFSMLVEIPIYKLTKLFMLNLKDKTTKNDINKNKQFISKQK